MIPGKQQTPSGFALIEVLVTLVILAFGLLGIAGLQSKALTAELESYQRAQALVIVQDMVDRIQTSRKLASNYAFSTSGSVYVGTNATFDCNSITDNTAKSDCAAWDSLLEGSAEKIGSTATGAMIGGKGCISYDASTEIAGGGTGIYTVTVAWQGMGATVAPPNTVTCGVNTYKNPAGATDEAYRRAVYMQFRIAKQS